MAQRGSCQSSQQRQARALPAPCLPSSRPLQQHVCRMVRSRVCRALSEGLRCGAQVRPFGGRGTPQQEAAWQQPATAVASQASTVDVVLPLEEQQQDLKALLQRLSAAATYGEKTAILRSLTAVQAFLSGTREGRLVGLELEELPAKDAFCLACLPALHQQHVLSLIPTSVPISNALAQLGAALARVEDFYDSIGGLVGYQLQCLALIVQQQAEGMHAHPDTSASSCSGDNLSSEDWPAGVMAQAGGCDGGAGSIPNGTTDYLVPSGLDLARPELAQEAAAAVAAGIEALPSMAEVYPLGGAGDRLGLRCEASGESLPTAVLQYCGRSLLENLVRDLQAREYLYWKLRGVQPTTPVAIMTSAAKGNHWRVQQLFEEAAWFGRGEAAFRLFQQPLVPMVSAADGRWLLDQPLKLMMKPGGHGVIWKLMIDTGVFDWLATRGRQAAIVRQISNPMAGTDNTLLALAGVGFPGRRSFGFASCERVVGAAEGMNVLARERVAAGGGTGGGTGEQYSYRITNVEYTEFERLGMEDSSVDDDSNFSVFPANTNVLYVGLQAVESTVRASMAAGTTDAVLPGMMLNLGKRVTWADPLAGGRQRSVTAGRLECTMQNLADCLAQRFDEPLEESGDKAVLDTFLVYNQRRKVTSSAKRKLKPGSTAVHQTPDGSFYDLQRNAADLLASHCGWNVPDLGSVRDYLDLGPSFVFLAHPALGPLWQVVGQKLRGGSLAPHSELQLEVAEVCLRDVHVCGSLRVLADAVMGHIEMQPVVASGGGGGGGTNGSGPGFGSHRSNLLDSLMRAAEPASSSTGSSTRSSLGSAQRLVLAGSSNNGSPSSSEEGYSQPCTFPAIDCDPSAAKEPRLVYSEHCGRLRLHNVRVENAGVDWRHPGNVWWRHSLARHESCQILLHGTAEFEARDVTLSGDLAFEVPDRHRMLVAPGADGGLHTELQPLKGPSWRWEYSMGLQGEVQLDLVEGGAADFPNSSSTNTSHA